MRLALLGGIALLLAAWRLGSEAPEAARLAGGLGGLALLLVGARLWAGAWARWAARRDARLLLRVAREAAAEHARTLAIKRHQMIVHDAYGNTDGSRWTRHLAYFIERVVFRDALARGAAVEAGPEDPLWPRIEAAVEAEIDAYEAESAPADLRDVRSGADYEHLCRVLLEEAGWAVAATGGSGDQGADLVAERDGCRVVLQCKFYAKPVGNRAVQEAFAAKRFQDADHAAVVSNAAFTRSARQLALTNDVLLLHHDELLELDAWLRAAA